jgi:hypothetical protein
MPRKHKVPPIIWTIQFFMLLVAPAVTSRREVIVVVPLLLSFPLLGFAIRSYWRSRHQGESGPGSRESLLYRWRKWMLDEKD